MYRCIITYIFVSFHNLSLPFVVQVLGSIWIVEHGGICTHHDLGISKILALVGIITPVSISLMRPLRTGPGFKVTQRLKFRQEDSCVCLTGQSPIVYKFHCFPSLVFLVLVSSWRTKGDIFRCSSVLATISPLPRQHLDVSIGPPRH